MSAAAQSLILALAVATLILLVTGGKI